MQTVSETYTRLLAMPGVIKQHKVTIGGVEYGEEDIVGAPQTVNSLYGKENGPSLGQTNAGQVDITVIPKGIIPRMAEIRLFTRLAAVDHMAQVVTETSEWLQKGVFLLDTRQKDVSTGTLRLHGYDRMLMGEEFYFREGDALGEWPRNMAAVVDDICARMGLTLSQDTVLKPDYIMPYPEGMTMREMLGYVAACHGCNCTVTDSGLLRFVPLVAQGEPVSDVGRLASVIDTAPEFEPFSGIVFTDGRDPVMTAGDETGRVLSVICPWATEEIAEDVLAKIAGGVYRPYEAADAILDPAVELGDPIIIDGVRSVLAKASTVFSGLMTVDIAAPGDEEVEHEIPYVDKAQNQLQQQIDKNQAILWTGIENADHLSTSRKISKYLLGDTSEDDFLTIKGLGITWIRARTDGTEVQATDINGRLLYWDPDVEKAEVGVDGQFYVGTDKVKYTIVETPYPVMVYAYEEEAIAQWKFVRSGSASGETVFFPTISMGAGYGSIEDPERGKGIIQKLTTAFEVLLKTSKGTYNGMKANDDYTDIFGLRRTTEIDLSEILTTGILYERIEGIENKHSWKLDRDDTGRPSQLTNKQDGHVCTVRWWSQT